MKTPVTYYFLVNLLPTTIRAKTTFIKNLSKATILITLLLTNKKNKPYEKAFTSLLSTKNF